MSETVPARPPAVAVMRKLGLEPDPWQAEVLEAGHKRLLLNCCRQSGKSTAVALLGLAEAVFVPFTKVLLVSRSLRHEPCMATNESWTTSSAVATSRTSRAASRTRVR